MVSDISMPEQSGYELIAQVRARGPQHGGNIPAIALTAYGQPEDRARALKAGFQMHMAKPIDADELVSAIASVLPSAPT